MTLTALRFPAALVPACLLVPVVAWLILVCADFAGLENSAAPHPAWKTFSLVMAAAITFPPAFHLWPDRSRPLRELLCEGGRAVLFAFAVFALVFIPLAPLLTARIHVPDIMLPLVMKALAPMLCCPLLWLSYSFARMLVPRPAPGRPLPSSVTAFGIASFLLVMLLLLYALVVRESDLLFPPAVPSLVWAFVFLCLRHALAVFGDTGMVPAWGAFCLLHLLWMGLVLFHADAQALLLAAPAAVLEIFSSACLLSPSFRRWLN